MKNQYYINKVFHSSFLCLDSVYTAEGLEDFLVDCQELLTDTWEEMVEVYEDYFTGNIDIHEFCKLLPKGWIFVQLMVKLPGELGVRSVWRFAKELETALDYAINEAMRLK